MIKVKDVLSLVVNDISLVDPNGEDILLLTGSEKLELLSDTILNSTVEQIWIDDCMDETIIVQIRPEEKNDEH